MARQNMQEPFSRFEKEFSEMYEIVRTVIVLRDGRTFRIEVVEDCQSERPRFKVNYSVRERANLEVALPRSQKLELHEVWVPVNFPMVDTDDALSALTQAMGFVARK